MRGNCLENILGILLVSASGRRVLVVGSERVIEVVCFAFGL